MVEGSDKTRHIRMIAGKAAAARPRLNCSRDRSISEVAGVTG